MGVQGALTRPAPNSRVPAMGDRDSWDARVITALAAVAAIAAALLVAPISHAKPGDIWVADQQATVDGDPGGAVFRVDPSSGAVSVVDFGSFLRPSAVAFDASGRALVIESVSAISERPSLFRYDPKTLARSVLATGPPFADPYGVAVEPSGRILVIDSHAAPGNLGALFTVDPKSGAISTLAQGAPFVHPTGVTVQASGQILVADPDAGAVFSVNPKSGAVSTLASGDRYVNPFGVVEWQGGPPEYRFLVADSGANVLWAVQANWEIQDFYSSQFCLSVPCIAPTIGGVARESDGRFIVPTIDADGSTAALFRLSFPDDPRFPSASTIASGSPLAEPVGVAVEPPLCRGKSATIFGSDRADNIKGSMFSDVIVTGKGNDRVGGGKGRDLICGGGGRDRLAGGKGTDRLYGQKGADTLRGGKHTDTCVGGKGDDSSSSCEKGKV
jgi:sugar lactone lactonase YvrE